MWESVCLGVHLYVQNQVVWAQAHEWNITSWLVRIYSQRGDFSFFIADSRQDIFIDVFDQVKKIEMILYVVLFISDLPKA